MPTLVGIVGTGAGEGDGEGTGVGEGDGEGTGEDAKGAGVGVGVVVRIISSTVATTSTPMNVLICDVNAAGVGGATVVPPGFAFTSVITLTVFFGDACTVMGTSVPMLAKACCNEVAFEAELAISSTFEASSVLMIALTWVADSRRVCVDSWRISSTATLSTETPLAVATAVFASLSLMSLPKL